MAITPKNKKPKINDVGIIKKLFDAFALVINFICAWCKRHPTISNMSWGLIVTMPPWAIVNYFSIESFANDIKKDWPILANALGKDALIWLLLAGLWVFLSNEIKKFFIRWNSSPASWENAVPLLLKQFDSVTGHKESRFALQLALSKKMTSPVCGCDVFDSITQPREQIEKLIEGVWQVFYILLPDYVSTSGAPIIACLGFGNVCITANASLGTRSGKLIRRLNRYCTSARYRSAYLANLNA